MSQVFLGMELGMSQNTISRYETGAREPSREELIAIADYFDVSVGYLCGSPMVAATEESLKTALFGEGVIVTDEMWDEIKNYAEYIKYKYKNNLK